MQMARMATKPRRAGRSTRPLGSPPPPSMVGWSMGIPAVLANRSRIVLANVAAVRALLVNAADAMNQRSCLGGPETAAPSS